MRGKLINLFESKIFNSFITFLIIFNSITIGLETIKDLNENVLKILHFIDKTIILVFFLEMCLKIYAYKSTYFKNSWNIFDFLIVMVSIMPSSGSFSIFRIFRIFRALRLLKTIPRLSLIVEVLLKSLPSVGWIFALLILVFYVYAVIGVKLFASEFPLFFGNIGKSFYTLFQVMTLESWSMGISRPVMEKFPYAFIYFVSFILISTYTTLNVFIAIVVNTMSVIQSEIASRESKAVADAVSINIEELKKDLEQIQEQIAKINQKITKNKN